MGGYSSGRNRTRNRGAVEATYRLDMRQLRRRGLVRPGERASTLWSWKRAEETTGSINVAVNLTDPDNGHAELTFSVGGEPRYVRVTMEAVACRYGGRRYYFLCPRSGRRCEVLCGVGGEFASRQHHRLTYFSQSETPLDRLARASRKAEAKLRGENGRPKPRGPNRERLFERFVKLETAWTEAFDAEAMRRFGYLM
jgi:hypothetical protein